MRAVRRSLLLALLCLPLLLLFSEAGARLALHITARFSGVEIEYGDGTLTGRLYLRGLRMVEPGVTVAIQDIFLELETQCLWRSVVCLRDLDIGAIDITLPPEETAATDARAQATEDTGTAAAPIHFPVAVEAPDARVASVRVDWGSGQWRQGAASLAIVLGEFGIRVANATIRHARLELDGNGGSEPGAALPSPALPLALTVTDLTLIEPALRAGDGEYALEALQLSGRWHLRELQLQHLALDGGQLGRLALREGSLTFVDDWPLQAGVRLSAGPATPWPALDGRTASVEVQGDLGALALRIEAPGEPALHGSARIDLLQPDLPFDATATVDAGDALPLSTFGAPPPQVADIQLLPPVSVTSEGSLKRQHLTVDGAAEVPYYGALYLHARFSHEGERLVFDELLLHRRDGDGELRATGEVSWRAGIHWSLAAHSPGLELPPLPQPLRGHLRGELHSTGSVTDSNWSVSFSEIDLQGEVNGRAARLAGHASLADGELRPDSELRGQLTGARLRLQPLPAGAGSALSLEVTELERWHTELDGQMNLRGRIETGAKGLALDGELSGIRWRDLRIEAATVTGHYSDNRTDTFETRFELSGVHWREIDLDALVISAQGDTDRAQATVQSAGDVEALLDVAAARGEDTWRGHLAPAQVRTGDMVWSLAEPVALTWSRDRDLRVEAHCWRHDAARICPGDWTAGSAGSGSVELAMDLALLRHWLPAGTDLAGELTSLGRIEWEDAGGVRADIEAVAAPLLLSRSPREGERQSLRWSRFEMSATLRDGALSARTAVHGDTGPPKMVLDVALPAVREGSLEGSLIADNLRAGALTSLIPGVAATGGTVDGRLRLTGNLDRPRLEGTLTLSDGSLKLTGNPTSLESVELQLRAQGDRARLAGTGRLGDGDVSVEGRFTTDPAPRLVLSLRGKDNTVLYPPSADLLTSHTLEAVITPGQLSMNGDITIHDGVLHYEQLPDHGVALSDDVVQVDAETPLSANAAALAFDMDVRVRIQEALRLRGPQLEATLSGDLRVSRKPREPLQVFGSLQTAGGTASAYERILEIKRGVVSFSGPPDNPHLDLRAQRRISGSSIIAGLHVHGELGSDLALDVYSDPPMSQSEAMSYLIWGRPPDSGNTGDGTVLALSLAGSVVNRSSLVSTINKVPGISNVTFGAEGSEEDAAATVSGYVGERLYMSYGIGIYEPVNVLTARFFLGTRLWLEVVSRLENSLDLYYSFDLD